jgi:hypothetical protein
LAAKHKTTVTKVARKHTTTVQTPHGPRKCIETIVKCDGGRKPLVARFGGIPLKRQPHAVLIDDPPVRVGPRHSELIQRLLAGKCELCGATANIEVHHIRKLADLNQPGRPEKPAWLRLMARRRRKTLVTCRRCHHDIHAGRCTTSTRR